MCRRLVRCRMTFVGSAMAPTCERLRRLATDDRCPGARLRLRAPAGLAGGLDDKTRALVAVAAVVATGAGSTSYQRHVADALIAGATPDEIVDTLLEVAPTVGLARLVTATVGVALGLGYDVGRAFEVLEPVDQL
jgi:4-carboxymuconolactone decarboxylase